MNEFPVSLQRCYMTWPLEFNVLNFLSRVTQLHFSGRKSHLGSISVLFTTLAVSAQCKKFLSLCVLLILGTSCVRYSLIFWYFGIEHNGKIKKPNLQFNNHRSITLQVSKSHESIELLALKVKIQLCSLKTALLPLYEVNGHFSKRCSAM